MMMLSLVSILSAAIPIAGTLIVMNWALKQRTDEAAAPPFDGLSAPKNGSSGSNSAC